MAACAEKTGADGMNRQHTQWAAGDETGMHAALNAALLGTRGANPLVGAAIVGPDGGLLHVGHHQGAGTPHAEVAVLEQAKQAGTDLTGCSMVVTLEPCNHTGRTGPCAHAIVHSGISRVVYALADPTDLASGGSDFLAENGVSVEQGLCQDAAYELNHRWFRACQQRRPFVTVKIAQSLDGRIAAADHTSQWITGEQSRRYAHQVRARVEAIVVGTQTVFADDPQLTVRVPTDIARPVGISVPPLRVVMGQRNISDTARVRGSDGRFMQLETHDPEQVLKVLDEFGIRHVLIEGGATVTSAFLRADLADELMLYQAPVILGAGRESFSDLGVRTLEQAYRYCPDESDGGALRSLGNDVLWHMQPRYFSDKD